MKILLTGGAGYIGSHTYVELVNAGHEAVIIDNFVNSSEEVLNRLQTITGKKVPFYFGNVCCHEDVEKVFSEHQFDAVIHFAGFKAVAESIAKPLEYYRNNLDSVLTLLEVMKAHDVRRLVFSSSATVYGLSENVPFMEDMPTGCINPYGWTKYMIEQILQDVAFADSNMGIALLRYFNPIGAHESGLIGEDPVGIPNNLMPYITKVASGELQKLHVFGNDYPTKDGTGVRDYIHVVDLARGHVCACEYLQEHTGCEVFNLGTGKGYSVMELVHTFENVNQLSIPYAIEPRRSGDIATCFADADKARRLLNWQAQKTLEDMCRDAWRWQSRNPKGYRSM